MISKVYPTSEDEFVLRDDTSSHGIRRLHVINNRGPVDGLGLRTWIEDNGGEIGFVLSWQDVELGVSHFYMAWKESKMASYPIWCTEIDRDPKVATCENVRSSVGRAAVTYHRKFGTWPNKAILRSDYWDPKIEPWLELQVNDEIVGRVEIWPVDIQWQTGVVGVYIEEA